MPSVAPIRCPEEGSQIPARSKFRIVSPERDTTRVNERIRVREVRVIGADGEQLGVMPPEDAIAIARESGLDLVEVAATSRPPVCRIMDYGKYKYEQKKKAASKKSHSASLKEVKLRPGTDQHDLNFKLNNARKFLMEGDKVKVTVMFRGREMVHTYRGREQLDEVLKQLGSIAKLESAPRMEGRFMSMILVADREAVAEMKRAAEQDDATGSAEASSDGAEAGTKSKPASDSGAGDGEASASRAETSAETRGENDSKAIEASDDPSGQESGADPPTEAQTVRE